MTNEERAGAAARSAFVAFGIIAVFAIFGRYIMEYLHISVESLQVSGGLLLLLIALELLMGKTDGGATSEEGVNIAIVPMGVPLVAGPGAIVTIMLAAENVKGIGNILAVALALMLAMFSVFIFLRFSNRLFRLMRRSGISLASRIAGLLLSAIAIQMTADGVLEMIRKF